MPGAVLVPVPSTRPHLVAMIAEQLSQPRRVGLLENASAGRDDPWLEKSSVYTVFVEETVLHLLLGQSTPSVIDAAIKAAQSPYLFVGAVLQLPLPAPKLPKDRGEMSPGLLRRLAKHPSLIFTGAYDGEGYVLWKPSVS